jgi:hypothetical protein
MRDILSVVFFIIYSVFVAWFWNHGNHSFRETVVGRRTKRETDRMCSDNEAGGRYGKAER